MEQLSVDPLQAPCYAHFLKQLHGCREMLIWMFTKFFLLIINSEFKLRATISQFFCFLFFVSQVARETRKSSVFFIFLVFSFWVLSGTRTQHSKTKKKKWTLESREPAKAARESHCQSEPGHGSSRVTETEREMKKLFFWK